MFLVFYNIHYDDSNKGESKQVNYYKDGRLKLKTERNMKVEGKEERKVKGQRGTIGGFLR